ncbi:hypothetical protein AVEN_204501-1 [Araneus ventricosus]|uniref:DUF4817 domain-containing protein n=1 Tax=Araneus ventricosus TaxID=182803 RepID=A0A4Y2SU32_ARAVE|nr:hypothetical protein AVEN_204501-1 [Araneus ventricosus]
MGRNLFVTCLSPPTKCPRDQIFTVKYEIQLLYRVSLNDSSGFKTLCMRGRRPIRTGIHDKMHTLPKFKSPPRGSLDGRTVAELYKMAAMQEKSVCVLEHAKCSSVTSVQRAFLRI